MSDLKAAVLLLEDGTFFEGRSCGADGTSIGEICFNTTAIGYPEVISDPGYKGQIVAMTYPQIGNYGINLDDLQSGKLALSGLVVRDLCQTPSNFRSDMGLSELLINNGVVAIDNIDTRQLVTHIRDKGAMQAIISAEDMDKASLMEKLNNASPLNELDLVEVVSTEETYKFELDESVYGDLIEPGAKPNLNIVVYDLGCKRSVLRGLARAGFNAVVVPSNTSASDILALDVDAVLFSNGPGSPVRASTAIAVASELVGKLPLFGVGLGHQIIALAAGGLVEKLKVE